MEAFYTVLYSKKNIRKHKILIGILGVLFNLLLC